MLKHFFIVLFVAYVGILYSQEKDMGLEFEFALDKDITKKIDLNVSNSVEFEDNVSRLSQNNFDIGIDYSLKKWVDVGVYYRLLSKSNYDGLWSNIHRYYSNVRFRYRTLRFKFDYRLRYQYQHKDFNRSNDWNEAKHTVREKFNVAYSIINSPFEFRLGVEIYTPLNNEIDYLISKYKINPNIKYRVNKPQTLYLGLLIGKEVNIKNPLTSYIFQVGYSYSL
jgi:hypothetical protein